MGVGEGRVGGRIAEEDWAEGQGREVVGDGRGGIGRRRRGSVEWGEEGVRGKGEELGAREVG